MAWLLPYYDFEDKNLSEFKTTLSKTARVLAPLLGPSVELLQLARPCAYAFEYQWAVHRIIRTNEPSGEAAVRAEYDSKLSVRCLVLSFVSLLRCILIEVRFC